MGLPWSIHFHFLNLYTGSVVARDLQVQIKIAIENSLLSKSPYETIHVYEQTFTKLYKVHSHWKYMNGVDYAIQRLALRYKVNYPPIVPMN